MCIFRREVLFVALFVLTELSQAIGKDDGDGELRFVPQPFSKKLLELNTAGKIHCKVAGGNSPNVTWHLNSNDPLPEGMSSSNGTLHIAEAKRRHSGRYTCRASDGQRAIEATITLDVVVSPRVLEPSPGETVHVSAGQAVWLHCKAAGEPAPTTHWDRNTTILHPQDKNVDVDGGVNASSARLVLLRNGTLLMRNVTVGDSDRYGCTAGSVAGLARNELTLVVHPEGEPLPAPRGVGGKAVVVSVSVAAAYMVLVVVLVLYCRRRKTADRGEKLEMEMAEGREKLVEGGEEEKKMNGAHVANGRLLPQDKDSGADTSEVSVVSRVSKKSGQHQYEHLAVSRSLLTEIITLGRGEFGDVLMGRMDVTHVRRLRPDEGSEPAPAHRPVLVKALATKEETQLAEFRRQLDMFSRVRHTNVVRLFGLCNDASPHYLILEHTDWGDLKSFLLATRTPSEAAEYIERAHAAPPPERRAPPLEARHRAALAAQLAAAAASLAAKRITHRDIAARNCVITSKLQLKLSFPALTRGPHSCEYYKLHDQVIPLRWLPAEAVLESDYSMKSDVYMYAATVWEIYTKAELPFVKLNDNSVMDRLKADSLVWSVPSGVPATLETLLNKCWSKSAADRPSFAEICEETTAILRDVAADSESALVETNEE